MHKPAWSLVSASSLAQEALKDLVRTGDPHTQAAQSTPAGEVKVIT